MRVILVPVADRPECINALNIAFELAHKLESNLCGCHVRAHSYSDVSLQSVADVDAQDQALLMSKEHEKGSVAAQALFGKIAEDQHYPLIKKPKAKPGAMWLEKVGSPDKVLSIMGPISDLIVVSRPRAKGGKLAREFMLAAIMNSSRPVLLLPQSAKKSVGRRISITCGSESGAGPKSKQLASYLEFWGVKAKRIKATGPDDAMAILNGYQDIESDLLVMRAYSRSRLRQSSFRGVTDFMLNRANIPIFMLHV